MEKKEGLSWYGLFFIDVTRANGCNEASMAFGARIERRGVGHVSEREARRRAVLGRRRDRRGLLKKSHLHDELFSRIEFW